MGSGHGKMIDPRRNFTYKRPFTKEGNYLAINAMQNIYVILTLTLNHEREKFMSTRQLNYWLPIAVYLAVKD